MPPTPHAPYRVGQPLADIIPPDRRRVRAAALVVSSMVAGITLWVLGGWALETLTRNMHPPPTRPGLVGYVARRVAHSVLTRPGGPPLELPPRSRSVVNVWLQGCADCMPAFEAMAQLQLHGGLGSDIPVVNVAYGEADETWATRYGVSTNLVFDGAGANVVRPLGIGTFTTLIVDPDGRIIHRDRPDRPGYAERVRSIFREGYPTPPLPEVESVGPPARP